MHFVAQQTASLACFRKEGQEKIEDKIIGEAWVVSGLENQ